jgi:osmotically-inducible protein OsmY
MPILETRPAPRAHPGQRGLFVATFAILILLVAAMPAVLWPADYPEEEENIPDSDITEAVEFALDLDEGVESHLIDVSTRDGVVTLSGTVDNILARDRSTQVAESIRGVRSVINNVGVACIIRDDDVIKSDVRTALMYDPVTDEFEIPVNVADGVVTLKGEVDSWEEKRLAGYIVKGIKGVKGVDNEITVANDVPRPDSDIKAEVERKLQLDPYVYDGPINVEVRLGVVDLSGTVGSAIEKNQATIDSWVAGVVDVESGNLEVQGWINDRMVREGPVVVTNDSEIKSAVEAALKYDPRTDEFDIGVEVNERVVTLTGTVDNLLAKASAESDAWNTTGVADVDNGIKVRLGKTVDVAMLTENVEEALSRDPILEKYDFTVLTRNQKVYLYGKVHNYCDRQRAKEVASMVFGVIDVDNGIEVASKSAGWSDQRIKHNIERQLAWSLFVDNSNISVSVKDGVATLTGVVSTWRELRAAVKNAFDGGASAVKSRLVMGQVPVDFPTYLRANYNRPLP